MKVLNFLMPLLAIFLSCTKPEIPSVQDKDDEPKTEVEQPTPPDKGDDNGSEPNTSSMKISIKAGGKTVTATLVKNAATDKLREILSKGPLTYTSSDNGFETYGDIGQTLPTSNENITAAPGDILLYASRYICIFWGSNTYSYTRLGRIEGITSEELKELFRGDIAIEIRKDCLDN